MDALIRSLIGGGGDYDLGIEDVDLDALEKIPDDELPDINDGEELDAVVSLYVRYDFKLKTYHCTACTYYTSNKTTIGYHVRTHTKDKPHECNECDFRTSYKNSLLTHQRRHMKNNLKCVYCDFQSISERDFDKHRSNSHSDKPYKCRFCPFLTTSKKEIADHELKHTGISNFKCDHCRFSSQCRIDLETHIKKKHVKNHCLKCDFVAKDDKELKAHKRGHHYIRTIHKCQKCTYKSIEKSHLARHLLSHHQNNIVNSTNKCQFKYNCSRCSYKTNKYDNYDKHVARHERKSRVDTNVRTKPFKCARCVFAAHVSSELYSHVDLMHKDTYY